MTTMVPTILRRCHHTTLCDDQIQSSLLHFKEQEHDTDGKATVEDGDGVDYIFKKVKKAYQTMDLKVIVQQTASTATPSLGATTSISYHRMAYPPLGGRTKMTKY